MTTDKGAFTPEQAEILKIRTKAIWAYAGLLDRLLRDAHLEIATLRRVLLSRGIVTDNELSAFRTEVQIDQVIELTLSPEM